MGRPAPDPSHRPRAPVRGGSRTRMSILARVRALLGAEAVLPGPEGPPRIAPASPDGVALLLATAHEEGWHVRVEGAGSWMPADAPADLALTTRRLDTIPAIEPQDLTATAEAAWGCDLLRHQLADRGVWLALDPPGIGGRAGGAGGAAARPGRRPPGPGPLRRPPARPAYAAGGAPAYPGAGPAAPARGARAPPRPP